jgi:GMP synthase-like glutamine amidotransferase
MKPIAIFRFSPIEGPGYFATFLDNNHIPWQLISIDQGEGFPGNIYPFSGLVLMGGPMSVNDNLPWIGLLLDLINQAVAHDVPVLGHCLGGQLMSKAFGGIIEANPIKELGWGKVRVADNPVAREWLGDVKEFELFHWHGETFSLPAGSSLLLSNDYCQNQAFALGIHLGMQCHVEMTEDMVLNWSRVNATEIIQNQASPAVQSADAMQINLKSRVSKLNTIADQLYRKWIKALKTEE